MSTAAQASNNAFGLVVRFTIRAGYEQEFDDLVAATVSAIDAHEPGTQIYVPHLVDGEPRTRIFYELYRDRAAFDTHEAQPHVRHFLVERKRLLESVDVDWVTPLPASRVDRGAT
jgi:quinol monooxygenase YgiN